MNGYSASVRTPGSRRYRTVCPRCQRRFISITSARFATHYETLSLPRSATRTQIKARFYKLSKDLHPDMNPSQEAKQRYLNVSEAYNVLGDDRRRREYDHTLLSPASRSASTSQASASASWSYQDLSRRRGATYAWDNTRRSRPAAGSGFPRADARSTGQHYSRYNDLSFGSLRRRPSQNPTSEEEAREQKVRNDSMFWRVVQVVGVVWLVISLGGGWSATT